MQHQEFLSDVKLAAFLFISEEPLVLVAFHKYKRRSKQSFESLSCALAIKIAALAER